MNKLKSIFLAAIFMVSAGAQALEVTDKSCEEGHPDYWVLSEEIFLDCKFGDAETFTFSPLTPEQTNHFNNLHK